MDLMLSGESIICLSSIDWNFQWQGHQTIMSALADEGNNVLFVENTGARSPNLRDLPRLLERAKNWRRGTREERDRLFVYSPVVLPFPYSKIAQAINRPLLASACAAWARSVGRSRPIVWTFLPTPLLTDLIAALQAELTIYYCIDDLRSSSRGARRIAISEAALLRTADLVFVTAERLRARAAKFRDQVHVFPFGVAYAEFERIRNSPGELPPDIRSLRRPIVGYVGGLNQKVDQQLLIAVARGLPDVQFVVIGPVEAARSDLKACRNVRILGVRPHAQIPHYLKALNTALIPYRVNEYTSHIYPAKLTEYLAMGVPVVTTPLPELRRFDHAHPGIVRIAEGADAFCAAVRAGIADTSEAVAERRMAVARANSWESRIPLMTALIRAELTDRRTRRSRASEQGISW